jgi:hypothetical protein
MEGGRMIWRDESYRTVLTAGSVDVGAIYPPVRRGNLWRWRIWLNQTGHPIRGCAQSQDRPRREVENRFRDFLRAAELLQIGGDA